MSAPLRHRGFTLWEVMLTLVLLSTFSTVSVYLLRDTMRILTESDASHGRIVRHEFLTGLLRHDAWGAAEVRPIDGGIELVRPDGAIRWTAEADGAVQRTVRRDRQADAAQRWTHLDTRTAFAPSRHGAVLVVRNEKGIELERIGFPSQLMLLEARR